MPTTGKADSTDLTQIRMDIVRCEEKLEAMEKRFDDRAESLLDKIEGLVTKLEFAPVKALVYGLVAILCTTVVGALLAKVIIK